MSGAVVFPEAFNLADYFVFDRIRDGKGDNVALRFGKRSWSYAQVAELFQVSVRTVQRYWRSALARLNRALKEEAAKPAPPIL